MSRIADQVRNAKILNTFLGVEDHGLFIMAFTVEYGDGNRQGFNRILASKAEDDGVAPIRELLDALKVDSWEKLAGKFCRVHSEGDFIRQIGHIVDDERWTRYTWGE